MAIRKSKEEFYTVKGNKEEWVTKAEHALQKGGFTNVKVIKQLNQLTADYKKLTIWGEIMVTILEENQSIKIFVKATANTDNIFALFSSPNQKILDQFKLAFI